MIEFYCKYFKSNYKTKINQLTIDIKRLLKLENIKIIRENSIVLNNNLQRNLDTRNWNDKLINDCQNTLDKWYRVYSTDIKSVQVTEEILKPLHEDLNTPGYIANLHKLYENANKGKDKCQK